MITFKHVTKKYANGHLALNNIDLQIEAGEMVFLQGHSGAGKSTLLKLIALLEKPTQGALIVNGQNLTQLTSQQIPFYRRRLGFISQQPSLMNNYSVFENIAIALRIAGFDRFEIVQRVNAALERVGLKGMQALKPTFLSLGEQQRIGIARAVVHKPLFLLADEPTGNLDPELSLEIIKLFERFHQAGVTVLIASHESALLAQFPYRQLHLTQGQITGT